MTWKMWLYLIAVVMMALVSIVYWILIIPRLFPSTMITVVKSVVSVVGTLLGLLTLTQVLEQEIRVRGRVFWQGVQKGAKTRLTVLAVWFVVALSSAAIYHKGLSSLAECVNDKGNDLMREARYLEEEGNAPQALLKRGQALGKFETATRLEPGEADFWYDQGSARRLLDGCEAAIPDYQKALELDRTLELAYNDLGYCYLKIEMYSEAAQTLAKGLEVLDSNQDIEPFYRDLTGYKLRRNLANAYIHLGRYPAAIALLKAAVEIQRLYEGDPKWLITFRPAETHCLLALVYDKNGYSCDKVREELDKCRKTVVIQEDINILENTKVTLERCPWGAD